MRAIKAETMSETTQQDEDSILEWVWGAVQGDFNEDPTAGQIITNAVITAIPVVDQVADARDLAASVKALLWDKRHDDFEVWLAFFFTLIGLVPSVGSLLKGVLKLVWKGAKLDAILRVFNAFAKGNGVAWLKQLRAGGLREYSKQAAELGKKVLDNVTASLKEAMEYIPSWAGGIYQRMSDLLAELAIIRSKIEDVFNKITLGMEEKLDDLLKEKKINSAQGSSKSTLMVRQEADEGLAPSVTPGNGRSVEMDGHKIYDGNFSPLSSNPSATYRFSDPDYRSTGGDVYFGENVAVSYHEVRKNIAGKSVFVGEVKVDNVLDLTDPDVAERMGIATEKLTQKVDNPMQQKSVYGYTTEISNQAYDAGYSGILYPSSRKSGGNNNALVLFEGRYDPDQINTLLNFQIP